MEGELQKRIKAANFCADPECADVITDILEIVKEAKKELEQAFRNDKTNFTSYESYRKLLKWFGE